MTSDASDRTLKLVSAAYGVAIEPQRFDDLLAAWDDWFDAVLDKSDKAFQEISPVFDDALSASSHLDDVMPPAPFDQSPVPTVLLDASDAIVAINMPAASLFQSEGIEAADVIARRSPIGDSQPGGNYKTFRLGGGPTNRSFLAVLTDISPAMQKIYPGARAALFLSLLDWNAEFESELAAQLDLSAAELRVARGLLEGRTAQEISGDLGRSLATIRSHIKALLQKTGARRQTELVQFLTILRQMSDAEPKTPGASEAADFEEVLLSGSKGVLQILRYGAGRPMLYFTTSSRPEETAAFRAAMSKAGFSVIAPVRPGFGQSDPVAGDASQAMLDDWLDMLLALSGPAPVLVGHREGGILAARAAQRIIAAGGAVSGLALLSTGAPVRDLAKFKDAPDSIRRSFLSAHIAAPALRLGYQTACRIFRASTLGQNQLIRFFHKDSPADRRKLKDPEFHELTRDLLDFCFENSDQIVRDVACWGSDWSDALDCAIAQTPVMFVHGSEHAFQRLEDIEDLTADRDNPSLHVIDGAGQLAIYEDPSRVAAALAGLVSE